MRPLATLVVLGAVCSTAACSVLLDWSDFTGGTGEAGADAAVGAFDAGGHDAAGNPDSDGSVTTCSLTCETAPPPGWTGPVALSVTPASQGAAPPCGAGFDATPAFDGYADLTASAPTCSACSCDAPSNVGCSGPTMAFYLEGTCTTPTGNPLTVSSSCSTTPFTAQGVTLTGPAAAGGTCPSSGGALTAATPTWGQVARACGPSSAPAQDSCGAGQVCAPSPSAPFSSGACVMQAGMATACPAAYPSGPQLFYAGVDDARACTPCACAGPAGGTCSSPTPAVDIAVTPVCAVTMGTLDAPSTCMSFQGLEFVTLASLPTLTDPGTCTLAGGGAPTGTASGAGATSFCCEP